MSLHWAHRSYCGFCHVAAFSSHDWQLSVVLMAKKTTTVLPGQYDWGLGVTVVYSHWEYASFRLITNKNMNGIFCMTLFNPFIPSPPFTLANSVDPGQMLQIIDLGLHYLLILGPVVQSIVSLTKSLVNDSLSLLVRLKSSVLIFFAEKMWGAFALQKSAKAPHIFLAKNSSVFMYNMFEILTSH